MERLRCLIAARRGLFVMLLACVLAVRLLVPAGWMPVVGAGGSVTIAVCTGMGPAEMTAPAHHMSHEKAPQHDAGGDHPCAFAGTLAATAAAPPAAPLRVAAVAPPVERARHIVAVGRGLAAPPPPSTGPPLLI